MEYIVCSNLNHDGKTFSRGDRIELSGATAAELIGAGVVQEGEIEAAAPVQEPVEPAQPEAADVAAVGGSQPTSGEPSLDGTQTDTTDDDTKEIGPFTPSAPDAEEPKSVVQGAIGAVAGFFSGKPSEAPTEPPTDPSANL